MESLRQIHRAFGLYSQSVCHAWATRTADFFSGSEKPGAWRMGVLRVDITGHLQYLISHASQLLDERWYFEKIPNCIAALVWISCFPAARRKLIRPRRVELHYLVVALKGLMKLSSNHHASIRYAPGRRPQSAQQWNSSASVRLTAFPILLHGFGRARWEKFFSFQDGILFVLATCKSWL